MYHGILEQSQNKIYNSNLFTWYFYLYRAYKVLLKTKYYSNGAVTEQLSFNSSFTNTALKQ